MRWILLLTLPLAFSSMLYAVQTPAYFGASAGFEYARLESEPADMPDDQRTVRNWRFTPYAQAGTIGYNVSYETIKLGGDDLQKHDDQDDYCLDYYSFGIAASWRDRVMFSASVSLIEQELADGFFFTFEGDDDIAGKGDGVGYNVSVSSLLASFGESDRTRLYGSFSLWYNETSGRPEPSALFDQDEDMTQEGMLLEITFAYNTSNDNDGGAQLYAGVAFVHSETEWEFDNFLGGETLRITFEPASNAFVRFGFEGTISGGSGLIGSAISGLILALEIQGSTGMGISASVGFPF